MSSRWKIILICYAISPKLGSEAAVGWMWLQAASRKWGVLLVTSEINQTELGGYHGEVLFVPESKWLGYKPKSKFWRFYERSFLRPLVNISYMLWGVKARKAVKQYIASQPHQKHVVHLCTYTGWRFLGNWWELGDSFVWGPVGGLENTNLKYFKYLGVVGFFHYLIRNSINSMQLRFLSAPKKFRRGNKNYSVVVSASSTNARLLKKYFDLDSQLVVPEICVRSIACRNNNVVSSPKLRIAWIGRLASEKCLPLLIDSIATLPLAVRENVEINVFGDGPLKFKVSKGINERGLDAHFCMHGWLDRSKLMHELVELDLLVVTSVKDLTTVALADGLSAGLYALVPDHCGFSTVIAPSVNGEIIPASSPSIFVHTLRQRLQYWVEHVDDLRGRSRQLPDIVSCAKQREQLDEIYAKCIQHGVHFDLNSAHN